MARGAFCMSGWGGSPGRIIEGLTARMTRRADGDQIRQIVGLVVAVRSKVNEAPKMVDVERFPHFAGRFPAVPANPVPFAHRPLCRRPRRPVIDGRLIAALP